MRRNRVTTFLTVALLSAPLAGAALADDQGMKGKAAQQPANAQGASQAGFMPSDEIVGSEVFDKQGQELGNVRNLLIDKDGRVKAAVISLGGIFGVGDRLVQVPWNQIEVKPKPDDLDDFMVTATRDTLQNAPQYDENRTAAAGADRDPGMADADDRAATAPADR